MTIANDSIVSILYMLARLCIFDRMMGILVNGGKLARVCRDRQFKDTFSSPPPQATWVSSAPLKKAGPVHINI